MEYGSIVFDMDGVILDLEGGGERGGWTRPGSSAQSDCKHYAGLPGRRPGRAGRDSGIVWSTTVLSSALMGSCPTQVMTTSGGRERLGNNSEGFLFRSGSFEEMGLDIRNMVMAGDINFDIAAANRARIESILVNSSGNEVDVDLIYRVSGMGEVQKMVSEH